MEKIEVEDCAHCNGESYLIGPDNISHWHILCSRCEMSTIDGPKGRVSALWRARADANKPKIRPLEWEDSKFVSEAKVIFGHEYRIQSHGYEDDRFYRHLVTLSRDGGNSVKPFGDTIFESLDAAKSAAQTHFEKQIMSAIVQVEGASDG